MTKSLVYITVATPFGPAEQFLLNELDMLKRLGTPLLIVPRSPKRLIPGNIAAALSVDSCPEGLFSPRVVFGFLSGLVRNPVRYCAIARDVVVQSRNWEIAAKNVAVLPKAFYLSTRINRETSFHIHAGWGTTPATIAFVLARLTGISWSMTVHRGDIVEDNLLRAKIDEAVFVRCISEGGKQLVRKIVGDNSLAKVKVLHLGAEIDGESVIRGVPAKPFTIVIAANLLPVKGHRYLIEACAILRSRGESRFECHMYGSGPLRDELARDIERRNLSEVVKLHGPVQHEDLLKHYRHGGVGAFVLPSINTDDGQHEGIPVALMEAMAAGVPVISTETGAISELLADGAGILIKEKSPEMLADAIQKLKNDTSLRMSLIENGRAVVASRFNLRLNSQIFLRLLGECPS